MTTDAEERFDEACENIINARNNFEKCIDRETWGSDNYSSLFKSKITELIHDLRKIELRLDEMK